MTALSHASSIHRGHKEIMCAASDATPAQPSMASQGRDAATVLAQIMPAARLALWEAWDDPLELIALQFGRTERATLPLEPAQTEVGASWIENVYPGDRDNLRVFLDTPDVVRAGKFVDYRLIVEEGELLWVRHWLLHRSPAHENRRRLHGMLMLIPEQKHLEWECLRVSERECNRVGQELHDDLCQVLAGMSFMTHVLGQRAAKIAPELGTELKELNTQITEVTERVRSMAHGLFPARLNYATLRDALNDFARQTRIRFSVQVTLDLPRKLPPHSPEQIIHVYRIAQEAVSNAVRHGSAKCIRVGMTPLPRGLQLEIEDDGTGFPASSIRPEGIGMHVMQYRARVLGGSIRFNNLTPRGAAVHFSYPTSQQVSIRSRKNTH
jgi:signal transduction histidine kinase